MHSRLGRTVLPALITSNYSACSYRGFSVREAADWLSLGIPRELETPVVQELQGIREFLRDKT